MRDAAFAGGSLALAALSAWYYAYMAGLLLALYVAVRLITLRRTLAAASLLRPALAGAAAFAVLAGPVALPSLALWGQGGLSHTAKAADEHSASPLDYVLPNPLQPVWGESSMTAHAEQNVIESSLYLGIIPVTLALAGWLYSRRSSLPPDKRAGVSWLVVLAVSVVLSLGLTLHGLGGQVTVGSSTGTSSPITLPGRLLYDWLPLFSSMRAYARFGVLAMLAVVVLLGTGWARITRAVPRRALWLTLVALCLLLADFWTGPYSWGTSRVEASAAESFLASSPVGSIIQLPLTSALTGPALFRASRYGKPIAYGYDTFEPPPWHEARPALAEFPAANSLQTLRGWGVRYVVVSANAYGADWEGTLAYLKTVAGLKYMDSFGLPRTWDVDPGVLDARPDMEEYALPDTLAVFELSR